MNKDSFINLLIEAFLGEEIDLEKNSFLKNLPFESSYPIKTEKKTSNKKIIKFL